MQSRILAALVLTSGCTAVSEPDTHTTPRPNTDAPAESGLLFGEAAREAVPGPRQEHLAMLANMSQSEVQVVYDTQTQTILNLALDWQGGLTTAADNALAFVGQFQALIDPNVHPSQYQVAPSDCGEEVVQLDRVVHGTQVVGSRMTLHFDEGRLVWVNNAIAPVPATVLPVSPQSLEDRPHIDDVAPGLAPGVAKTVAVLAPREDFAGLYPAEATLWFDGERYVGALVVSNRAMSAVFDATGQSVGRNSGAPPVFATSKHTEAPASVDYGALGGMAVTRFATERNPIEFAYRFLEEHPTLLRTGAPRCQYTPTRLSESPSVPGVFTARLHQEHGGLKVMGTDLLIRSGEMGRIDAVHARVQDVIEVTETYAVSRTAAIAAVDAHLSAGATAQPGWAALVNEALARSANAELLVLPAIMDRAPSKTNHLAWRVDRGGFTVVVDANSQEILWSATGLAFDDLIRDANGAGVAGFFGYTLHSRDGVPVTGAPMNPDIIPGLGGQTLATTVDNFKATLVRAGIDGLYPGRTGDFTVNVNVNLETGCGNGGFYDFFITDNAYVCNGRAAPDTIGHEFTHGVLWHHAGLWHTDEPGAIAEAYGDLLGNLAEDPTGTSWLHGEDGATGAVRNMANMAVRHYGNYRPRPQTGCIWPWDCDFGNVHTNMGIINRAHVLMTDGFSGLPGIGRERMLRLAGFVIREQLPGFATMSQLAGITRDVCDMFVARGVTTSPSSLGFTSAHCDVVTAAFLRVGLDPGMSSGWSEPSLGFAGAETVFAPVGGITPTTPNLCPVDNILLQHNFLGVFLSADYDPATPRSPRTSVLDFVATTAFDFDGVPVTAAGPAPLGSSVMTHRVRWTSIYGVQPSWYTTIQSDPTCVSPANLQQDQSRTVIRGWDAGNVTGAATVTVGAGFVSGACPLVRTPLIELVDSRGVTLDGPSTSVEHKKRRWFGFVPVDFWARADVLTAPVAPGTTTNLSGRVRLGWDIGRTSRVRWRYDFSAPIGVDCPTL